MSILESEVSRLRACLHAHAERIDRLETSQQKSQQDLIELRKLDVMIADLNGYVGNDFETRKKRLELQRQDLIDALSQTAAVPTIPRESPIAVAASSFESRLAQSTPSSRDRLAMSQRDGPPAIPSATTPDISRSAVGLSDSSANVRQEPQIHNGILGMPPPALDKAVPPAPLAAGSGSLPSPQSSPAGSRRATNDSVDLNQPLGTESLASGRKKRSHAASPKYHDQFPATDADGPPKKRRVREKQDKSVGSAARPLTDPDRENLAHFLQTDPQAMKNKCINWKHYTELHPERNNEGWSDGYYLNKDNVVKVWHRVAELRCEAAGKESREKNKA